MAVKVGELYQELSLKDDKFKSGMKSTEGRLKGLSNTLGSVGGGMTKFVTGPLAALGGTMLANATKTGNYADSVLDLASATGHSTERIQEYQAVAERAGVDTEAFTSASQNLVKAMGRGEEGSANFRRGIESLGLSYEELEEVSPDERMDILMESLRGVEDAGERAKIGNQVLKGSYEELAPMLDMSAEEFEKVAKAAHDSGKIMDEDALEGADDFRKGLDELKQEFTGLLRTIAVDFMPILTDDLMPFIKDTGIPAMRSFAEMIGGLIERFTNLSPQTQKIIGVMTGLAAALGPVLIVAGKVVGIIAAFANPIGIAVAAIAGLTAAWVAFGDDIIESVNNAKDVVVEQFNNIKDFIINIFSEIIPNFKEFGANIMSGLTDGITEKIDDVKNAVGNAADTATGWFKDKLGISSPSKVFAGYGRNMMEGLSNGIAENRGEPVSELEKLWNDMQKAQDIEEEWERKLLKRSETRLERLKRERDEEIAKAEEVGAETWAIEEYYNSQIEEERQEMRKAEREREEERRQELIEQSELEQEEIEKQRQAQKEKYEFIRDAFHQTFYDIMRGTKSVSEAFRDMWSSVIDHVIDKLAEMAASKAFSFITGGGSGGILGGIGSMFGGIFHDGGVVPGPIGQERLILAQAGEHVSPIGSGRSAGGGGYKSANIYLNIDGRQVAQSTKQHLADTVRVHGGARY